MILAILEFFSTGWAAMDSADVRFAAPKASPAAAGEVPRSGGGGALDGT